MAGGLGQLGQQTCSTPSPSQVCCCVIDGCYRAFYVDCVEVVLGICVDVDVVFVCVRVCPCWVLNSFSFSIVTDFVVM